jgi:hypothetical protein
MASCYFEDVAAMFEGRTVIQLQARVNERERERERENMIHQR